MADESGADPALAGAAVAGETSVSAAPDAAADGIAAAVAGETSASAAPDAAADGVAAAVGTGAAGAAAVAGAEPASCTGTMGTNSA
ncbi:hypothetical protein [Actinoplanes oblitus]|uniref:hypothetical protein n=1 Tax=Actinoplanes oblitus TaxID=3040509 RepID=UPI002E1EAECF